MIKPSSFGFTLIELLAVVIVMGILSVVVVPHLNSQGFQSQFLIDELVSTLQAARERAVASGCAVRVAQNPTTKLIDLYFYTPCNGGSNQAPLVIYTAGQLNTSVNNGLPQNVQVALSPTVFYFNALGQVYQETPQASSSAQVTVTELGESGGSQNGVSPVVKTTSITVNPAGFVSFQST